MATTPTAAVKTRLKVSQVGRSAPRFRRVDFIHFLLRTQLRIAAFVYTHRTKVQARCRPTIYFARLSHPLLLTRRRSGGRRCTMMTRTSVTADSGSRPRVCVAISYPSSRSPYSESSATSLQLAKKSRWRRCVPITSARIVSATLLFSDSKKFQIVSLRTIQLPAPTPIFSIATTFPSLCFSFKFSKNVILRSKLS